MTSTIFKVRLLMFITVLCSIAFLPFVDWTSATVTLAAVMYFIYDCLGVVVANHRYWSHKSFKFCHPILKYTCSLAALLSGTGSTLGWAGLHRLHHKHSDKPEDPHQQARGFWKTIFIFYKEDNSKLLRVSIDNARNKFLRITDRYWLLIIMSWVGLLLAISPQALYFVFILPSALTMLAQGMTNYMCHSNFGYVNYDNEDNTVNCPWIAPFNWGEAWHNTHHANPAKTNLREKWWEVDIAGMIINAIKAR